MRCFATLDFKTRVLVKVSYMGRTQGRTLDELLSQHLCQEGMTKND